MDITADRLDELEQYGPAEACLCKAELRELIRAYRERPRVVKNETDGAWLMFEAGSKKAAISVECIAAKSAPLISETLRAWSNSIATTPRAERSG